MIPGTSHFDFLMLTCASAEEYSRLNSRSEVMILSRARDALQTPADTRFQWKGQGRGLKNTHKSHFAFPRLPGVVKIKGMHGTPDRTA